MSKGTSITPQIEEYTIFTCMGKLSNYGYFKSKLSFLNEEQEKEFNNIGYTGKNSKGEEISRQQYLNSLGLGTFKVKQTKFDHGDFCEEFLIIRVTI
jgi:hypothetical protein